MRTAYPLLLLAATALPTACAWTIDFDEIPFGRDVGEDTSRLDTTNDDASTEDTSDPVDAPPSDPTDEPTDIVLDADTPEDIGVDTPPTPDADTGPRPDTRPPCVPTPEICDGIDNSCNGLIDDEDPDVVLGPDDCGRCGVQCGEVPGGVSTCVEGVCLVDECDPGRRDLNGDASDGCEYSLGEESVYLDLSDVWRVDLLSPDRVLVVGHFGVVAFDGSGARLATARWDAGPSRGGFITGSTAWGVHDGGVLTRADFGGEAWTTSSLSPIDELDGRTVRTILRQRDDLLILDSANVLHRLMDVDSDGGRTRIGYPLQDSGIGEPALGVADLGARRLAVLTEASFHLITFDDEHAIVDVRSTDATTLDLGVIRHIAAMSDADVDDASPRRFVVVGTDASLGVGLLVLIEIEGAELRVVHSLRLDASPLSLQPTLGRANAGIVSLTNSTFVRFVASDDELSFEDRPVSVAPGSPLAIDSAVFDRFCFRRADEWGCRTDVFTQPFVGETRAWEAGAMTAVGGSEFLAHTGGREITVFRAGAQEIRLVERITMEANVRAVAATNDGRALVLLSSLSIRQLARSSGGWERAELLQLSVDDIVDIRISQGFLVLAAGTGGAFALRLPASGFPTAPDAVALLPSDPPVAFERMTAVVSSDAPDGLLAVGVGEGQVWAWPLRDLATPTRVAYPLGPNPSDGSIAFETATDVASTRPGRFAVLEPGSPLGLASLDFTIGEHEDVDFVARPFIQAAGAGPATGEPASRLVARNNFLVRTSPSLGIFLLFDNGFDSLLSAIETASSSEVGVLTPPCRATNAELLFDGRLILATECGFLHYNLRTPP